MIHHLVSRYKNRARYKEILSTVARHGFAYWLETSRLRRFFYRCWGIIPGAAAKPLAVRATSPLPVRVRMLLEDLGPTFIKLGQLLSIRPDLIPPDFAEEFSQLQDRAHSFGSEEVRKQCREIWGNDPEKILPFFDYRPLACASVAQVHRATLPSGEHAVVKIQRPGLAKLVERDLAILKDLKGRLKLSLLGKVCDVDEVLEIFSRQMRRELDFVSEGLSIESFREMFEAESTVVIPKVYWAYTGKQVLTMEYIRGSTVQQVEECCLPEKTRHIWAETVLQAVLVPFFKTGIFHGDPHPGNVLLLEENRVALVDFGIIGRLDHEFRRQVAALLLALAERDVEAVVEATLKIGRRVTRVIDRGRLYEDMAELMDRVGGINQGNLTFGDLIKGMIDISIEHGLKMPGSFFILGRAVSAAENIARRLCPEVNMLAVVRPLAVNYLKHRLQPRLEAEQIYRQTAELAGMLVSIPRDIAQILEKLARGDLTTIYVHKGLEPLYQTLDVSSARMAISLIVVAMMGGSALIIHAGTKPLMGGVSVFGMAGFVLASILGTWMVVGMLRQGKLQKDHLD
ncbi:MAG: ABC1 kinase family protein [Bacillota bacterium]